MKIPSWLGLPLTARVDGYRDYLDLLLTTPRFLASDRSDTRQLHQSIDCIVAISKRVAQALPSH